MNTPFHSDWNHWPLFQGASGCFTVTDHRPCRTCLWPSTHLKEYWEHLVIYTHHGSLSKRPYQSRSQFAPLIRVIYKIPLLHTCHQCNRISFPSAPAPPAPLQCRASIPATFCFLLSLPSHYGGRSMPVSQVCYGVFHSLILCLKMWELLAATALFRPEST